MLEIGSLLDGKYKILSEIGRGGMSVVYMAINEKANKTWAVKEVRREGVNDFKSVKQGLIAEAEMLKKLHHKFLPSIIDIIDMQDSFIIIMDYIEGISLKDRLKEYGAQPQDRVVQWSMELCDVLGYLHSRTPAIIYRDMKPSNVMLRPDWHITLIDFGTAKEFKEFNVKDTISLGTIGYAAPEQFGGKSDARTDIYCLGATMYHLVTGNDPSAPSCEIRPIREINPALSSGLEKIIQKCTQRNPENRYQSCAELLYDLEHYKELDILHLKKQWRKMIGFGISAMITIGAGITALAANNGAQNRLKENYDYLVGQAAVATLTQKEKEALYIEAIQIDPSREDAYLKMIDMYLEAAEDKETGNFTREEAANIVKLKAGLDIKDNEGFTNTVKPLQELQSRNPEGYAEVCYEIGKAYWYDYEVENERYKNAVEWFQDAAGFNSTSPIFVEIGQCRQNISKYEGQSRTDDMNKEYAAMWESMKQLVHTMSGSGDDDTKRLVWRETISMISDQIQYFTDVPEEDIKNLLQDIKQEANNMYETTKYPTVKPELEELLQNIQKAEERVQTEKK